MWMSRVAKSGHAFRVCLNTRSAPLRLLLFFWKKKFKKKNVNKFMIHSDLFASTQKESSESKYFFLHEKSFQSIEGEIFLLLRLVLDAYY